MAALQASNRGRVVSVPAALVTECMECLEEMATADLQVKLEACRGYVGLPESLR